MRNLLLVGTAALALAACQQASDPALGAPHDNAAQATEKATIEASPSDDQAAAAVARPADAEAAQPQAAVPEPPDTVWYVAAPKLRQCENLFQSVGVLNPEELLDLFETNNMPLEIAASKADWVHVRERGNTQDPGMILARGRINCWNILATLG